jgi:hypothetical protein
MAAEPINAYSADEAASRSVVPTTTSAFGYLVEEAPAEYAAIVALGSFEANFVVEDTERRHDLLTTAKRVRAPDLQLARAETNARKAF